MPASYPGAITSTPTIVSANMSSVTTHTADRLRLWEEVTALEQEGGLHPSGAYATVKARLDANNVRLTTNGAGAVGFITEGQIAIITLPAQTVAGNLFVWGTCFVTKTVAANAYNCRLRQTNLTGTVLANDKEVGSDETTAHPTCSIVTTAGAALVVVMTVAITGGGSGTCFADGTSNRIDALWMAGPA